MIAVYNTAPVRGPTLGEKGYDVHQSSFVDEPCRIGTGTKIRHFCHVMKDSEIGRDCDLGHNVLVSTGVRVGDGCRIEDNVSLYTGVVLEEGVFCGSSTVFTNVLNPRREAARTNGDRKTLVRRGASLGANSTVVCGVTIGEYAFVGAGAVVTRDVADYALVVGNPARRTGWMCRCGIKLPVEGEVTRCAACATEYRMHAGTLAPA
jgi:UDP-2-acetamido-3-amino-2,3-dideoxy-glucuronate N-acetyltransferase